MDWIEARSIPHYRKMIDEVPRLDIRLGEMEATMQEKYEAWVRQWQDYLDTSGISRLTGMELIMIRRWTMASAMTWRTVERLTKVDTYSKYCKDGSNNDPEHIMDMLERYVYGIGIRGAREN